MQLVNIEKRIIRGLLHVYYIFPIRKNRVIFNSMTWKQYSCNPKYITEYLLANYPGKFEIIWAFEDPDKFAYLKEKGITTVKTRTPKYYKYRLTSRVSVCNVTMGSEVPPRKGQYRINTWHGGGGGYKRIDYSDEMAYWPAREMADTDLFCASSETSLKNTVRIAFKHEGEYFGGTPRNDMLVNNDRDDLRADVHKSLKLDDDTKILLYAPTYREGADIRHYSDKSDYGLDYLRLKKAMEDKFGGNWAIAIRFHPRVKDYTLPKEPGIVDATVYPDMQELLASVDAMVTDYSSSLWDFSFTGKPCIQFCEDLEEYKAKRGFNKPIEEWGFPIATSNDEMESIIENWDWDTFNKNMDRHHTENGSFEDGTATKRMCEIIYNKCFGDS